MGNEVQKVWSEYARTRSEEHKRALVMSYINLVRYVVSKTGLLIQGKAYGLEADDITHFGILGLVHAIERYHPGNGVKFETYAIPRIRGAILDEFRKLDWVPRSVREGSRKVARAAREVSQEVGREAVDSEIAEKLSISLEEYYKVIHNSGATTMESVSAGARSRDMRRVEESVAEDIPSLLDDIGEEEAKKILIEAVGKLPDRERALVGLYYFEGLKFGEIGLVLHLSESRVSQIHAQVLRDLREKLGELR